MEHLEFEEVYQPHHYETRDDVDNMITSTELEELITEKLMEGWTLLKRKCPSCNTSTLLQANDMLSDTNSEEETRTTQPTNKSRMSNVPYCVGCKAHVVTDRTMIECVPSLMNDDYNYATKGKILVTLSMLDDVESTTPNVLSNDSKKLAVLEEDESLVDIREDVEVREACEEYQPRSDERDEQIVKVSSTNEELVLTSSMTKPEIQEVKPATSALTSSGVEVNRTNSNVNTSHVLQIKSSLSSSFLALDYRSRREIATKELGSKLLEGYTLKNIPCDDCGMPVMEKDGIIQCVICPFLAKKAQGEEREDIEVKRDDCTEDIITKSLENKAPPTQQQPSSISEMLKKAEEAMKNAELKKLELSQRVERMKLTSSFEFDDTPIETGNKLIDTDKLAELKYEEERKRRNKVNDIVVTFSHEKKIEALTCIPYEEEDDDSCDDRYGRKPGGLIPAICSSGSSNGDIVPISFSQVDTQDNFSHTKEPSNNKATEQTQRIHVSSNSIEVEKPQENEQAFLERLEKVALQKVKAADEAILKARDAMDKLSMIQQPDILDILNQAETKVQKEIIDEDMMAFMSDIENESLEKRVCKIRDLLANRVLKGWSILPTYCKGELCGYSPLVRLNEEDVPTCVVCGGSGNGMDGLYLKINGEEEEKEEVPAVINIADDDHEDQFPTVEAAVTPTDDVETEPPTETPKEETVLEEIKQLHQEDADLTNNGYSIDDVVAAYGSNSLFVLSESNSTMDNNEESNELSIDIPQNVAECVTEDLYETNKTVGIVASPTNTEPLYVLQDGENQDDMLDIANDREINVESPLDQEESSPIETCESNTSSLSDVEMEFERIRLLAQSKVEEQMRWEREENDQITVNIALDELKNDGVENVAVQDIAENVIDSLISEEQEELYEANTAIESLKNFMKEYNPYLLNDDIHRTISEVPSDEIVLENSISVASNNSIVESTSNTKEVSLKTEVVSDSNAEERNEVLFETEGVSDSIAEEKISSLKTEGISDSFAEERNEVLPQPSLETKKADDVLEEEIVEIQPEVEEEPIEVSIEVQTELPSTEKTKSMDELNDRYLEYMNTINVLRNTTLYYNSNIENEADMTSEQDVVTEVDVKEPMVKDAEVESQDVNPEDEVKPIVEDVEVESQDLNPEDEVKPIVEDTEVESQDLNPEDEIEPMAEMVTSEEANPEDEANCSIDVSVCEEPALVKDDLVKSEESIPGDEIEVTPSIDVNTSEDAEPNDEFEVTTSIDVNSPEEVTPNVQVEPSIEEEIIVVNAFPKDERSPSIKEEKDVSTENDTNEDNQDSSNVVTLQLPSDFNFDDENAVQFVLQQLRMNSAPAKPIDEPSTIPTPSIDAENDIEIDVTISTSTSNIEPDGTSTNSDDYEKYLPTSLRQDNTNRLTNLSSIVYEPVLPFLADTLSCTIGEMLNDGWTLLNQPPCKGCNAPLMIYKDTTETIGQCVNVECPLSCMNNEDGETEVQSWDDEEVKADSYDEDDSCFFEEDDPAIIQMQLNEMRKRGLIINDVQEKKETVEEVVGVEESEVQVMDEEEFEPDTEFENVPSEEDAPSEEDEIQPQDEHEEEVKMKSYISTFADEESEFEENIAITNTFGPPTPEARLNRNRNLVKTINDLAVCAENESKLTDEDTAVRFSFDEDEIDQQIEEKDDVDQQVEEDEQLTHVESFENDLIQDIVEESDPIQTPETPKVKRDGPPRPEDDEEDEDDLCYEPPRQQNQNIYRTNMKRTTSYDSNEIHKKDSFTNLIINTACTNADKHPTDVSLLTSASFQQESIAASTPATSAAAAAYANSQTQASTKILSHTRISGTKPNYERFLHTSASNIVRSKSINNGPPRPDLYDIDESVADDNMTDFNTNNMGLPLVIESGYNDGINYYDNESLLSCEESFNATSTIGSESLANILCKIEHVKDELSTPLLSITGIRNDGGDSISYGSSKFKSEISNQMEMAQLIERLASAAIAVKQMEKSKKSSS